MSGARANTKSAHIKAGVRSVVALVVSGLGVYALAQGILQGRPVFVIEGAAPTLLGGWALWVLAGYWMAARKGGA